MSRLNGIIIILGVVLSSCASNEELWQGSISDFTSSYVEELHRIEANDKKSDSNSLEQGSFLQKIFIEKAFAKKKKAQSLKAKPLILKTSGVRRIQKRQAKRMYEIDGFKAKKVIGEKENGLVGIRTLKGLNKKEKKKVKALVDEENKDRNNLYGIIVKASHYDKKMELVLRKSFFESYQEWAPSGTYYYKNHKWQTK